MRFFDGVFSPRRWFAPLGAMPGFTLDAMDILFHASALRTARVEFVWTNSRADRSGAAGASERSGRTRASSSGFHFPEAAPIFLLPDARNSKLEAAGAESDLT